MASSASSLVVQFQVSDTKFFINHQTTSCPCSFSNKAETAESTPPESQTNIFIFIYIRTYKKVIFL
jgi:hypothetical protein